MYHGTSKIIKKSKLDEDLRKVFLSSPYFYDSSYVNEENHFQVANPRNDIDRAVLEMLSREGHEYDSKYIEYWFQNHGPGGKLWPHVDFNHGLRIRFHYGEKISQDNLMSPMTIACYLDVEDMVGGEFCISERSWLDYEHEISDINVLEKEMNSYSMESFSPKTGDILYFEGSRYYHWINQMVSGKRVSMLINFWNEIDSPSRAML